MSMALTSPIWVATTSLLPSGEIAASATLGSAPNASTGGVC